MIFICYYCLLEGQQHLTSICKQWPV
jgi:hypothetical protein